MRSAATPASASVYVPPPTAQAYLATANTLPIATLLTPQAPSPFSQAEQLAQAAKALADAKAHQDSLAEQHGLLLAIAHLTPVWTPLPTAPYPPGNDTSGFPRSGDLNLVLNAATVSKEQLGEPARVAKGLSDQALARRPKLTPLFWVGLACLGVGIYLAKK